MRKVLFIVLIPFVSFCQVFDGASGYGADWSWPSSYEIYVVSNLNSSGSGSLKDAVESSITSSGRIVVFNGLSGTITLTSAITFNQSGKSLYVAGQTSDNGIIVRKSASSTGDVFIVSGGNGVIIRSMTFSRGESPASAQGDSFNLRGGANIVVDRCSFVWGFDETVGIAGATNFTIQNSIIAESLSNAGHTEGEHSKGMIVSASDTGPASFYRNLFALNVDRNPIIGGESPGPPNSTWELVQNLIYGWDNFGIANNTGTNNFNLINNVEIRESFTSSTRYAFAFRGSGGATVYPLDNYDEIHRPFDTDPQADAVGCYSCGNFMTDPLPSGQIAGTPFNTPLKDITTETREGVRNIVVSVAGDYKNAGGITSRIRSLADSETGVIIDNPSDVGGWPSISPGVIKTDSDGDGIPDSDESVWGNNTFGYVNNLIINSDPPPSGGGGGGSSSPDGTKNGTSAMLIAH